MAKKSIRKSHDDMLRLLRHLVNYSTKVTDQCELDYQKAKKLIAEAPKVAPRKGSR